MKTVASPQQQRLLLGTPPNVHNTQDNHNPVQENSPTFDSRIDTGIYPSPISIKRREKLTPESQAAKDRMQMLIRQDQQLRWQIDTSTETSDASSSQSNGTPED